MTRRADTRPRFAAKPTPEQVRKALRLYELARPSREDLEAVRPPHADDTESDEAQAITNHPEAEPCKMTSR